MTSLTGRRLRQVVRASPSGWARTFRKCFTEGAMGRTMRVFITLPCLLVCLGLAVAIPRLWNTEWRARQLTGRNAESGIGAQMQKSFLTCKRAGVHRRQSLTSNVRSKAYARLLSGVWHASRSGSVTAPGTALRVSTWTRQRMRFYRMAPMHRASAGPGPCAADRRRLACAT